MKFERFVWIRQCWLARGRTGFEPGLLLKGTGSTVPRAYQLDDTGHHAVTRAFLEDPAQYPRHLLGDGAPLIVPEARPYSAEHVGGGYTSGSPMAMSADAVTCLEAT